MNKKYNKRIKQKNKSSGLFFLFIQIIIISPLVIVWLYTIFTASEPFLRNNSWSEFSKVPITILTIIFGITFLKIGIKNVQEFLARYTIGVLMAKVIYLIVIAWLLSMMLILIIPISATQVFGSTSVLTVQAQKELRKPTRNNTCVHYLNIQSIETSGSICIGKDLFDSLPADTVSLKVKGRQGRFGLIIHKMDRVEPNQN